MNELEEIRTFVQLVDSRSATHAADVLGVAVSAVSRRMKGLETRLGVRLLHRSTRSMRLTEEGALYYDRCIRILADLREAEAEVTERSASLQGLLRIAAPLSFGMTHLSPALFDFMRIHPGITVELDMSDKRVDLIEDGFDLAIRIGNLEDSTLKARNLVDVRYAVCASPWFIDQYGLPQKPEDLQDLPALCYSNLPNSTVWKYVGSDGVPGSVSVKARLKSSNGDSLSEAAIAGLGVLCEPSFIVNAAVENRQLQAVLTDYQWFKASVFAVYPATRYLSHKSRRFIDFLVERFSTDSNWEAFLN